MIFINVPTGSSSDWAIFIYFISDLEGSLGRKIISKHTCNISCRWHIAGQNILTPSVEVWKKLGSILYSCQKGERYALDIRSASYLIRSILIHHWSKSISKLFATANLKHFLFNLANKTLSIGPVKIRHIHACLGTKWQIQTPLTLKHCELSETVRSHSFVCNLTKGMCRNMTYISILQLAAIDTSANM